MKQLLFFILCTYLSGATVTGQTAFQDESLLLGVVEPSELMNRAWYKDGKTAYTPYKASVQKLKTVLAGKTIEVFFGSWCSDSQREVPRLMATLESIHVPITLIAVDSNPATRNVSPTGEETGKYIFRVPTIIVYEDGQEVGRLVEYPKLSIERDLVNLIQDESYLPNYPSYLLLAQLDREGALEDPNVDYHGLAMTLQPYIATDSDLRSAARIFQNMEKEATQKKLLLVNAYLFKDVLDAQEDLMQYYITKNDPDQARAVLTTYLHRHPKDKRAKLLERTLQK